MIRVRSVSDEGVYYLVNGWKKHKAFWYSEKDVNKYPFLMKRTLFKDLRSAKCSMTKLLKVMDDYKDDVITYEEA